MFDSIFTDGLVTPSSVIICLAAAFITGLVYAVLCCYKTESSRSFLIGTAFLPTTVALVICLVNGNIGAGVAIAGAFGLVRFRSAPGTAREISIIFIAMAAGLAFGMGYIGYGIIFLLVCGVLLFVCELFGVFEKKTDNTEKYLKITIPEGLNYSGAFDDIFDQFASKVSLEQVRTVNMGSMFKLTYKVKLKDCTKTKEMIDMIRCRNANLEVTLETAEAKKEGIL